jgi:hypothetical protein
LQIAITTARDLNVGTKCCGIRRKEEGVVASEEERELRRLS